MADVVPNEELRALVLQMYAMWEARDFDGLTDLYSRQPCPPHGGYRSRGVPDWQ